MAHNKLLITLPLFALLASCGGGQASSGGASSSSASASSASSGATSSATSVTPTGKVTVPFWTTFGQKNGETLQAKADEFEEIILEEQGVEVEISLEYQGGYDDILNKITQGFSAGNIPTMAVAYPDHVANYLANEPEAGDYVYDVTPYMNDEAIGFGKQAYLGDEEGVDDFVEAFVDEGTHYIREGYYSMPYMKSSEVMFYNFSAVKRAMKFYQPDIENDEAIKEFIATMTWDQLLELSEVALENKDSVLSTLEQPIYYDSDSNLFITKMYQEGIPYCSINDSGKGVIEFESGEARTNAEAMVTALKEAHDDDLLITKDVNEGKYGSDAFNSGKCLFEIGSSGGTGYQELTGDSIGVCKVPASNENPLYVSQGPTITFLKNPAKSDAENDLRMQYAWQFYKFITNAENNVFLCVYGSEGYVPVRYSAFDSEAYISFLEEGEVYAETAKVLIQEINGRYINSPVFQGSAGLRDQCGGIITGALFGNKGTVTELFDAAITNAKKGFGA